MKVQNNVVVKTVQPTKEIVAPAKEAARANATKPVAMNGGGGAPVHYVPVLNKNVRQLLRDIQEQIHTFEQRLNKTHAPMKFKCSCKCKTI